MCKPLPQERFCMSATTPPGSPWTPTPMPPSGYGGRRRTPSALSSARRCNSKIKAGPDGNPRPGLLSLSISNAQSYITDFSVIVQIFSVADHLCPDFPPGPFRSTLPYGSRFGQRRTAKANRSKEFSKMKKSRANHMDLHGCVMCWEKRYPFSVKYNFRYSVINLSFLGVILPVFFLRLGFQPRKPR